MTRDQFCDLMQTSAPLKLKINANSAKVVADVFAKHADHLVVLVGAQTLPIFTSGLQGSNKPVRLLFKGQAEMQPKFHGAVDLRTAQGDNWPYYVMADGRFVCSPDAEGQGFNVLFNDQGVNTMFTRHFEAQWAAAKPAFGG